MPVSVGNLNYDWYQQGECEGFVALKDSQEVIVFEEAHGSVCNLKMGTCNTFDESFEEFWDEGL